MSRYRHEVGIVAAAACLCFLFLQGIPLWDSDYSVWLSRSNSLSQMLLHLLLPWGGDPTENEPLKGFFYRLLSVFFGTVSTGYFVFKTAAATSLAVVLFRAFRQRGFALPWCLFALGALWASPAFVNSLILHSDFSIYGQLCVTLLLLWSVRNWGKETRRHWILFFAAVYLGGKFDGIVRIVPWVLLGYAYFFDRTRFRRSLFPLLAILVASLPWSTTLVTELPAYATRFFQQLFSILFDWVGYGIGFFLFAVFVSEWLLISLMDSGSTTKTDKSQLLLKRVALIWLAVALLSQLISPRPDTDFDRIRGMFDAAVPSAILVVYTLQQVHRRFVSFRWTQLGLGTLVVFQALIFLGSSLYTRETSGRWMIAMDRILKDLEYEHPTAVLLVGPDIPPFAYRDSTAPVLMNRRSVTSLEEAAQFPVGQTFVLSRTATLDQRFAVVQSDAGCVGAIFDFFFECLPERGVQLLQYVGSPQAMLDEAQGLAAKGEIYGAVRAIEKYLDRHFGNHGVVFQLGLLAFRAGDLIRAEAAYGVLGRYFPDNVSIQYNLAVAKLGLKKYEDAVRLLEPWAPQERHNYGIVFNYASALYRVGRRDEAIEWIEELAKSHPNDEAIRKTLEDWKKGGT